jgi:tripartite-type tricarboxylate transporter receptor subunit TctC
VADVILRGGDFGRPWVMPPATPAQLVKIMREAYARAMADGAMLDEAKRTKLETQYVPGEELQQLAEKMLGQPPSVVKRVKALLGKK